MKTCKICKRERPLDEFSKNASRPDGKHYNCKACDAAKSMVWHNNNKDKVRDRQRKWREVNLDRLKAKDLDRYYSNREVALAERRELYSKNREKIIRRVSERASGSEVVAKYLSGWRRRNTPKTAAYTSARRAKKNSATPKWLTNIHLAQIQELYDIAAARTTQTGVVHNVDHIVPLKSRRAPVCGLHVPWNLQVITRTDNLKKSDKLLCHAD